MLISAAGLGLGSGVGAALFADIARVTSTSERTAVMAVFMAVRQIGLLIGVLRYHKIISMIKFKLL